MWWEADGACVLTCLIDDNDYAQQCEALLRSLGAECHSFEDVEKLALKHNWKNWRRIEF